MKIKTKRFALGLISIYLGFVLVLILMFFLQKQSVHTCMENKDTLFLKKSLLDLEGILDDNLTEGLSVFIQSCNIVKQKHNKEDLLIPDNPLFGQVKNWISICNKIEKIKKDDDEVIDFLKENFDVYNVNEKGLFTGYYGIQVLGSLVKNKQYNIPLLGRPYDMVDVYLNDLGIFSVHNKVCAKIQENKVISYPAREKIVKEYNAPVVLWLENLWDLFVLQREGMGIVKLTDGNEVKVSYAGDNNQPFVSVEKILRDKSRKEGFAEIRDWVAKNTEEALMIMNQNPRYIFFKLNQEVNASFGGSLFPERSLAVDTMYIPLGVPMWLNTDDGNGKKIQKMVFAHDRGNMIKGRVRGDFFWGYGKNAETKAGKMKSEGEYYVFVPKR